ncbi:hypothetical protein LPJ76_001552 [Coemansia sp. RSA 638]|nr:hypothetical protein LPJ76_001552 [Coemansia sp. RSA 638]
MSVNKPLPVISEATTVDEMAYIHTQRPDAACGSGGLPRYDSYGLAKRFSVALSTDSTVHPPAQLDKDGGINSAKSGQGSTKPPANRSKTRSVATSYYNSRLAPIRGGPALQKSYHGAFQGVPLASATAVPAKPPPLSRKSKSSDVAPDMTAVQSSTRSIPALTASKSAVATSDAGDLYTSVYDRPRPSTSAQMTAAATLRDQYDESPEPVRVRTSHSSSQSQSSNAPTQCVQRPRTTGQTMKTRRLTEWRDIHVKSLSRVDTILREAVGLSQTNPNRWSVIAPTDAQMRVQTSGLGISISQQDGRMVEAELKQRPGTSHYALQSRLGTIQEARPQTLYSPDMLDMLQPFAPPGGQRADNSAMGRMARPSTSSARLGRSTQSGGLRQHNEVAIVPMQTSISANGAIGSRAARTGEAFSSNRVVSMYIPSQQTKTSHRARRQMSMYYPSNRPIQLSRDETRRSRLFAEYEQLIATKDSDDGADDDEIKSPSADQGYDECDNSDESRDSAVAQSTQHDASSIVFVQRPSAGLEDINEETEEAFSSYEEVVDTLNTNDEDPRGKRASVYVDRPRPFTAHTRANAGANSKREIRALSMHAKLDLFSKQQTERRWSRIISQNQHLFSTHTAAAPIGQDENLFEISEEPEERSEGPSRALATQSLVLDLPHSVDLFQDVTQALAERLPPLSAGSTTSVSSASTVALRHDSTFLANQPLSTMPRPQSASSKLSNYAKHESCEAADRNNKRESIYIDPESLFNSALFADEDLPYQQGSRESESAQHAEYTPTIAAKSLPDDKPFVKMSEETTVVLTEPMAARSCSDLVSADDSDGSSIRSQSTEPQRISGEQDDSDIEAEPNTCTVRHSAYVREQLRLVEGATPAMALGTELSKNDDEHKELLMAYMQRFDFEEQPIDFALRQLFREFHLPSESQQIDRVITSFAERYHACNSGLFFSAETVYAYAFAILLLHTDAHNPRVRHKMTKTQFTAHAKLLDESATDDHNEMFDEILDIIYENVTMVKFEYAPSGDSADTLVGLRSSGDRLDSRAAMYVGSAVLESAKDQSPGISGWLRRMFAPASSVGIAAKPRLSPQEIPSKEQYSYTAVGRRRVGSISGLNGSPFGPAGSQQQLSLRPSTAHGTFPRSSATFMNGAPESGRPELMTSATLPCGRANTSGPSASTPMLSPIKISFSQPCESPASDDSSASYTAQQSEGFVTTREMLRASAARPFKSSPLAGGMAGHGQVLGSPDSDGLSLRDPESPDSPRILGLSSCFTASDIATPTQPIVESIRLKGIKNHVKRRVSLRRGRPLSGIIYQAPSALPVQQTEHSAPASPLTPSALDGSALLRVDMAGHVTRKMERLDHGRRGFVRRWKGFWMVLSGSRLYMFRSSDGGHSESPDPAARAAMTIQTITSLRNGVAIVDAAYIKYPHVFRILADDGSEMLVKAADDDAVAEWMARINCAAAFKSMGIERRSLDSPESDGSRALELESRLESLDQRLAAIDDSLEHNLRLFKQLASMVPLTRQGRAKTVQYASTVRQRLKGLYLDEQRLTCYVDVLELDLAIEYELAQD